MAQPQDRGQMKDRATRIQSQITKQMEQLQKASDKLAGMADDPNADPAALADLEQAVQDHQANVDKLAGKLGV